MLNAWQKELSLHEVPARLAVTPDCVAKVSALCNLHSAWRDVIQLLSKLTSLTHVLIPGGCNHCQAAAVSVALSAVGVRQRGLTLHACDPALSLYGMQCRCQDT